MRAIVFDRYGPPEVLRLEDVEPPMSKVDEVRVRVHATTVNRTDIGWRMGQPIMTRLFTGLSRPRADRRILGSEFGGEVEAVGAAVTQFDVGDRVFGTSIFGAHAELVCMPESGPIERVPEGMAIDEAAAVLDGAILALGCLAAAGPLETLTGRRILIYGASGSIGTAATQLARHFGAHVTAVCSTKNLALLASLGADEVIDYTVEDFTTNGQTYDVIFDSVGTHSFRRSRRSLRRGGTFIETDLGFLWHVPLLHLATRWVGSKRVKLGMGHYRKPQVRVIKELIEAGKYRAVIDRRYPLEEAVEATQYVETLQKTGNVVLTLG